MTERYILSQFWAIVSFLNSNAGILSFKLYNKKLMEKTAELHMSCRPKYATKALKNLALKQYKLEKCWAPLLAHFKCIMIEKSYLFK